MPRSAKRFPDLFKVIVRYLTVAAFDHNDYFYLLPSILPPSAASPISAGDAYPAYLI